MADSRFYVAAGPFSLKELAAISGAKIGGVRDPGATTMFSDVRPLDTAGPDHVSFFDNKRYFESFKTSRAGACLARPGVADKAPKGMALLLTEDPYRAYAKVAWLFYPRPAFKPAIADAAVVDETAKVDKSGRIEAGAVIGPGAEIGRNSHIGANAVIGESVVVGDDCVIGPCASLAYCIVGKRVIVHGGVRIGQDGFGFAPGPRGHLKVPQLGRVIIEDDVEIGANTTIDRGTGPDTIVGAGTKIDNLVQIAHNVKIGKNCIIVSQVGISGSTEIGDFTMMGGQAGLTGHLRIGAGAKIAAQSGVMRDVEAGAEIGGSPARPMREWLRREAMLQSMVKKRAG